ncbi:MAG: hypothetical protein WCO86_15715, partial [Planctomycetota bacterium]
QFQLAKTIMFPGCSLSQTAILERALSLDHLVRQLATEFGIPLVEPEPHWYGFDAIHVVPKFRGAAFQKYFAAFELATPTMDSRTSVKVRIDLPTAAARTIFGRNRTVEQPVFRSPEFVVSAW